MTLQELGLNLSTRRTGRAVFLDEMNLVAPWTELLSLIAPHAPRAKCTQSMPCWASVLVGTKFMWGLDAASQTASASFATFLPLRPCIR